MRIIINQGQRLVDGEPVIVAAFSLVQDFDDTQEVVFSGSMDHADYTALIAELQDREDEVWA